MDFGDDVMDGSDGQHRKKRYHRHTPRQIQQLEAMFKECPHPDENQRMQLSRELGLEPRQIKFWFQNRRTQMKAQHERQDNCFLRAENDKIRCENIAMREALRNVICPTCGGPPVADDYFDEQKLRMENARLKEELDRVSSLTSKYLGRPFTQLPPVQPLSMSSSLDLSVGGLGSPALGPSLDLDLLSGGSSGYHHPAFHLPTAVSEMERPMMAEMATRAMDELIRMAQAGEQLWARTGGPDGREVLNVDTYDSIFSKPGSSFRGPDVHVEGSRDSGLVFMSAIGLVDMFMDSSKWMEFFPAIVSNARTIDVLVNGMAGRSESLVLMYEELHVMSPVVPTRELCFLRYCRQIEHGLWAIADVSVDLQPRDARFGGPPPPPRSCRLPSGCLIADMANGYSKVTWVEHMEVEDRVPIHLLYRDLILSGAAFGAHRWLAALQRACERCACLATAGMPPRDNAGVTPEGNRSMMKLSQRMVSGFCASLSASQLHRWTTLSGPNDVGVRVMVHRSTDPGQPSGVVLSAATSIWLPVPCDRVFAFICDENTRSQWDVLSHGNPVQEVSRIPNGSHPGNCISLLRGLNASQNSMLILQESCTDASGSLVVYAPIDIPAANVVMSGEDPSAIPLLPSGFTILPDGRPGASPSSSAGPLGSPPAGSLVTVAFQILVSSLPSSKLNAESVATVNSLISTTVEQIKAALNCASH
ncbi:homeobox-leucine zipper protein ROC8-like [Panicum miliaceum]|uniref:Homeobox-leucine zipper protein ROC8-like n=1 Tax=Panicum miliaceum TaxID=4540 RepID=A0A3L6RUM3_PANMI|nr:homeobox-leucine zipper protein ROC8-like [Panicum miliaceum]